MIRLPRRTLAALALAAGAAACGPGHQPAYIGPSVELDFAFPETSPDRLFTAVQALSRQADWPVDSLLVDNRRLLSGWMPAPEGTTDCGSYREVPGNIDPFENEEYRLRITVSAADEGSAVRVWTDHRATGWYGEEIDDCVTTGRIQREVRGGIASNLGNGGTR